MPIVAGLAAYVRAGGPLRGAAAVRYAYERTVFECILAMRVLENGRGPEGPVERGPARADKPL